MESRRVLKKEGLNLTIDKEVLDDQRVLEVSTELPEKAKVEKEDKDDFENYKVLYKGAIDDRCLEEYGTCEDEKLWEDTAKEMFLKAANYIPEEDKKADGELVDREEEQEPTLVRENRSVIQHNKIVENKKVEDIETNISTEIPELSKERMEELMPKMLDFIKENDYENHYFENLATNGMYSRMRIFNDGTSNKFYDYVQAYEQVISAMAYENKNDYVTDLIKYDKEILGLNDEEYPLVTTNLTVRNELANKFGIENNAPKTTHITELKKEEKINFSEDGNIAEEQVYTLQDILDAANTINDMWNSLGNELTDQIDSEFDDNPSHCIRWLISNIEDVLENDAKGIISENKDIESKDCSKQVEDKECPKQN